MKSTKFWIMILIISFFIAGCTDQPGPLPSNMSRIQVTCIGLSSGDIEVVDASTDIRIGEIQAMSCVLYGELNFDVPVPPYSFKVRQIDNSDGRILIGTVTFTGPGETKTVRVALYKAVATAEI